MQVTDINKKNRYSRVKFIILVLILVVAVYLRFVNLVDNPGWYSDEGTLVEIAQNLAEGKFQYLAINKSTLLVARLPLFPTILAGIFSIVEPGITPLRYLSSGLGVLTVGLLYWVVLKICGKEKVFLAITAAFFLAIYPPAILYNRVGLSYSLLAPLVVLLLWFMWNYLDTGNIKNLLIASILLGLGSISDLMMFTLAPAILFIAFYKSWKDLFPAIGLIILPFCLYSLAMIVVQREAFLFDFTFTFFRLGEIPIIAQFPAIVLNYASLIFKDYWWTLGIAGMFILPASRIRYLLLILFFTPVFMLARTTALSGLGLYYLSPIFPLIMFGAAAFITKAVPYVLNITKIGFEGYVKPLFNNKSITPILDKILFIGTSLILFMIVISPFVFTLFYDGYQVHTEITSEISPVLVNTLDAHKVISFVNQSTEESDLVLASPAIAWAIDANVADFQMAIASQGGETKHFPTDIPADRFNFDPDYKQATLVIIDPIWRNWAVPNMVEVGTMVENVEEWPLVFSSGLIEVYQNPNK